MQRDASGLTELTQVRWASVGGIGQDERGSAGGVYARRYDDRFGNQDCD